MLDIMNEHPLTENFETFEAYFLEDLPLHRKTQYCCHCHTWYQTPTPFFIKSDIFLKVHKVDNYSIIKLHFTELRQYK